MQSFVFSLCFLFLGDIGKVTSVRDGNTIVVHVRKFESTITLNLIDAPDEGQPFFEKSKSALTGLVQNKYVHFTKNSEVSLNDISINEWMVEQGLAWYNGNDKNSKFFELQEKAKKLKKGIWIEKDLESPWDYRNRIKNEQELKAKETENKNVDLPKDPINNHFVGPRGGVYHYSKSGKKVYDKK